MSFTPLMCPDEDCPNHHNPRPGFYKKWGSYTPKCRRTPVPRFKCKDCNRGFSRQTFRADYYDKKPETNDDVYKSLATGLGIRQTARNTGLDKKTVSRKLEKMGRHLEALHANIMGLFKRDLRFQFDEMESFERNRRTCPVTIPVLVHEETLFVVDAVVDTIPPSGKMSKRRLEAIEAEVKKNGPRVNRSKEAVTKVLEVLRTRVPEDAPILFKTDLKSTYPGLLGIVFDADRVIHLQFSSKLRRDQRNPLFIINNTAAMIRDLCGRLRRRSWLATKKRRFLSLQLFFFITYRNYVRRRRNREKGTPAQHAGFTDRALSASELLSWRQDWGPLSPDVRCNGKRTVREAA